MTSESPSIPTRMCGLAERTTQTVKGEGIRPECAAVCRLTRCVHPIPDHAHQSCVRIVGDAIPGGRRVPRMRSTLTKSPNQYPGFGILFLAWILVRRFCQRRSHSWHPTPAWYRISDNFDTRLMSMIQNWMNAPGEAANSCAFRTNTLSFNGLSRALC